MKDIFWQISATAFSLLSRYSVDVSQTV